MRYFHKLEALLLKPQDAEDACSATAVSTDELVGWNEEIEGLLFAKPEGQGKHADEQDDPSESDSQPKEISRESLDQMAKRLQENLLQSLCITLGLDTAKNQSSLEKILPTVINYLKQNEDGLARKFRTEDDKNLKQLEVFIRTSSNFFRWYLQIHLESCNSGQAYPLCSAPFQSPAMLTIITELIEQSAKFVHAEPPQNSQGQLSPSQCFARHASLLLFYVTFSPLAPNDQATQKAHEYLVAGLDFIPKVLKLLTYESGMSAALALSLIRNVHNLMVSYSGAAPALKESFLPYDETTAKAPWNPKKDDNTDGLITYPSVFRDILIWSLNTPDLPPFPGSKDDRRADLVVEILGILFAMGGSDVTRALRYPAPNVSLSELVITALQKLDSTDLRCRQVQLSTITIMMDACPSFATFLVEHNAVKSLFEITEKQMDMVLDSSQFDNATTAALIPSLAVLYKFSAGNPTFRDAAKEIVFPPSQEEHFQKLVAEHQAAPGVIGQGVTAAAKNMHPLDAPQGTLRWKLIRLMTWTESNIKRYASELLWALSEQDPKEFVHRTGLGNAMAFLGAKGMVQLPSHVHQG